MAGARDAAAAAHDPEAPDRARPAKRRELRPAALFSHARDVSVAAPHSGAADRPGDSSRACQNDRGKPRTCSARYARMRLVEIGATRYRRVSRNLRSTSYSAAKPNPPWVCRHTLAASHDAFAARYFAMFASAPQGLRRSNRSQAFQRIRSAAWISM